MLYVSTRNGRETYTAQRTLLENRAPDGGLFVPCRLPKLSQADMDKLGDRSFNSCVAAILNLLFDSKATGYDVGFAAGRTGVRLKTMGHRMVMGECWHNLEGDFSRMVKNLYALVSGREGEPTDWARTGIRVAVLFGIFSELARMGVTAKGAKADIALVSGDFTGPMGAWYARKLGLPVGNIVCCCNDNSHIWDFFSHGQLRTDGIALQTETPEADVLVPTGLERLIFAAGGSGEVETYLEALRRGGSYFAEGLLYQELRRGMYASVTSRRRVLETIPRVFGTHSYLPSPYTALAYSGLQDYRSRMGDSPWALILAEKSPEKDMETVAKALGITAGELQTHLEQY